MLVLFDIFFKYVCGTFILIHYVYYFVTIRLDFFLCLYYSIYNMKNLFFSIYPLKDPLFFSSTEDQPDSDLDSEDSNAENNWRNDYPDEDDMLSVNEDDMVEAMKNVDLEDDLLSSDEGEEGFVYSIDSEAVGFEEDIDDTDVHRYGERYARFKARHKKGLNKSSDVRDLYYGDIDDEEDDEEANNSYY